MLLMSLLFMMMTIISITLMLLTLIISKKNKSLEKLSPFECGFDLINKIRSPFSMKFFLIAIIFLIFDIEIAFFLPMILNIYFSSFFTWMKSIIFFLLVLNWGLFHEWFIGSLKWKD